MSGTPVAMPHTNNKGRFRGGVGRGGWRGVGGRGGPGPKGRGRGRGRGAGSGGNQRNRSESNGRDRRFEKKENSDDLESLMSAEEVADAKTLALTKKKLRSLERLVNKV